MDGFSRQVYRGVNKSGAAQNVPLFFSRLVLADVLKKSAGEDWQVEFDMEDDEKDTGETVPNAHLHKLAGVGDDGRGQ